MKNTREVAVIIRLEEVFYTYFSSKFLRVGREELKRVKSYIACREVIMQAKHQNLS